MARLQEDRQEDCIIVNADRVVLGRTTLSALAETDPAKSLEDVMATTIDIRPDERLDTVVERMRRGGGGSGKLHDVDVSFVVTDHAGRLLGVVYRKDVERAMGSESEAIPAS